MDKAKLQWHPAFGAALRITLQDEMRYLEMHEEYLLSKKPLQMDILIIKKLKDIQIRKDIGRIFRKHNIIEYKSPSDNLSINDFYKVYGYACVYQSDTNRVGEIRKLMREYEKHRKSKDYAAVMDLITRANWEQMEVEKKMCDALKELFAEELKEADSKGRTEGIQQGFTQGVQLTKQVLKLAAQGESPEMISEKCSISLEQVKEILEEVNSTNHQKNLDGSPVSLYNNMCINPIAKAVTETVGLIRASQRAGRWCKPGISRVLPNITPEPQPRRRAGSVSYGESKG